MTKKISVSITIAEIVGKAVKHLAVIGKRAKDVNGNSLFSDITISENEKGILNDLIASGAETIVNQLAPFCGMYNGADIGSISFVITSQNWTESNTENDKDLTKALEEAIYNYLLNYTLAQYLSIVRPSTGEKYPPIYGSTYTNHCALIIQNIIGLCNLNRVPTPSGKSYASIKGSVVTDKPEADLGEPIVKPNPENGGGQEAQPII